MPGLGGLRYARPDSPDMGWHNASLRGFADYMQTAEFAAALQALIERAKENRIALVCAEAVPWRCHRSLTPWASVQDTAIVYPIAKARRYEAAKKRSSKSSSSRSHGPGTTRR